MKKKLLSMLVIVCLIFPFVTLLTACGHTCTAKDTWKSDATHHWHECTDKDCDEILDKAEHTFTTQTVPATLDADGKVTKTCSVCAKVIETPIPKLTQTADEKIAVLASAVNPENYRGELQFVYSSSVNTTNYYQANLQTPKVNTEVYAKKADGTFVYYDSYSDKPAGYTGEIYVDNGQYIKAEEISEETKNVNYQLGYTDGDTKTNINYKRYVGNDYAANFMYDSGISMWNADLYKINSKDSLISTIKSSLISNLDLFSGMMVMMGINATYDKADIVTPEPEITYANGVYTIVGEMTLAGFDYSGTAQLKFHNLTLDYKIVYSSTMVFEFIKDMSYEVETVGSSEPNATLYRKEVTTTTTTIEDSHFDLAAAIVQNSDEYTGPVNNATEYIEFIIDGNTYTGIFLEFGSKIKTAVDAKLVEIKAAKPEYANATITAWLDENYSETYDADTVIRDNGMKIYLKIEANQGYSVVISNYIYTLIYDGMPWSMTAMLDFDIVAIGEDFTIEYTGEDYMDGQNTIEYTDAAYLDGSASPLASGTTTIEVTAAKHTLNLHYDMRNHMGA